MNSDLSICHNIVMAFFRRLDERDYVALTEMLAADAVWYRQGLSLNGPAAVHEAMLKRSPTMRIHHLITNLVAEKLSTDSCYMRAYMLVVRHDAGVESVAPAPLSGIENIRTTNITLQRDGENWRITKISNDEPTFSVMA